MSASNRRRRSAPRPAGAPGGRSSGPSARTRLAAERARRAQRRRRLIIVAVPVGVVLVAVVALVVVRLAHPTPTSAAAQAPAADPIVAAVTSVPAGVLDQIGAGTATTPPKPVNAPALTADGKPRVLYVGAEYCPYCAAERWAMVVALSRFGTFSGLGQTTSSAQDVDPSTATLSFHGSSFSSPTIAFTGVEMQSNQLQNGQYAPLDQLSAGDEQLVSTYDAPPYEDTNGAIPFVDIGGKYLISGASYDAGVLAGKSHQQIATSLSDPSSDIAEAVDGTANLITAAVCSTTADAPAAVCTSPGVRAAADHLS